MPAQEPNVAPLIVAHRGLHQVAPENSAAALVAALKVGFRWVECDVWDSLDGFPVVIHDESLERTTTGAGLVRQRRSDELRDVRLRDGRGEVWLNERLATLGELDPGKDWCAMGLEPPRLLIEIKPRDARMLTSGIAVRPDVEEYVIQSFDEANLIHALTTNPHVQVAYLIEDRSTLERAVANGWDRIHVLHELVDNDTIRWLRSKLVSVGVWTPNAETDLRRCIGLGLDMIITDEPERARRLVDAMGFPGNE